MLLTARAAPGKSQGFCALEAELFTLAPPPLQPPSPTHTRVLHTCGFRLPTRQTFRKSGELLDFPFRITAGLSSGLGKKRNKEERDRTIPWGLNGHMSWPGDSLLPLHRWAHCTWKKPWAPFHPAKRQQGSCSEKGESSLLSVWLQVFLPDFAAT